MERRIILQAAYLFGLRVGAKTSMLNGTREQDDKRRPYLCGPGGYTRHGIDVGDGRVIHYGGEPGGSEAHASIRCVTLQEFAQGGEVRDYGESFGPDEAVARAESKLGERDYDLFGRHGEHFASWCVSDRNAGAEINEAAAVGGWGTTAAAAAATGGGAVAGVAGLGGEPGLADAGTMVNGPGRTWSLRREWSRAFTVMLVLLLVSAAAAIGGVRGVVDELSGTAFQLDRESVTVAALRKDLVDHEQIGHKLLSGDPVDRSAFVQQQQEISRRFDETATVFAISNGMRAIIVKARQSWQNGLMTFGLWGDQVAALHGNHLADNPAFGASSDGTRALLDGIEVPSHDAMDQGIAHGEELERILIVALAGLFALALAVIGYFRRRMVKDLVRPVASMHQGVLKLQAGDYNHRIEVARGDELGELAQAFNGMAGALHDSHLALTFRATHDSLTGLANRASLAERLTASFSSGSDRRARQEGLLFIDIDDFKDANDSLGHEGGDELLIQLATRLNDCVRAHDLVARLGGDEFAILVMEDDDGGSVAVEVAERILDALRVPFIVGGDRLVVTVSIGVAQRRPEIGDAAELLRHADFAMYMAKGGGKARYQLFDAQMYDNMVYRSALKTDLAVAVASGQLRLDYQPVADLRTGEILGVEALVRWQHPRSDSWPQENSSPRRRERRHRRHRLLGARHSNPSSGRLAPNHAPLRQPVGCGQPLRVPTHKPPKPGGHPTHPGRPGGASRQGRARGHRNGTGGQYRRWDRITEHVEGFRCPHRHR